jgi:acetoacetyl-CoA synthetase
VCQALIAAGVGPGDTVAAWMPNTPETVIVMLAASSVGAVFTSTSPDFGPSGVLDRFGQVKPKVLVAADGYVYAGKTHDRRHALTEIVAQLPSLREVWLVREVDEQATIDLLSHRNSPRCPSTLPVSCSIPPGPPVLPSALCTGLPDCSSNTRASIGGTSMSVRATASSGSPPAAG